MSKNNSYVTKKIGKNNYGLHTLKAREGFSYGLQLRKLMPVSGSFADAQTSSALEGLKFSTMAEVFLDSMDSLDIEDILETVVYSKLTCNGQDVDVDEHFQANLGELVDVVAWALEVNFKSLFLESTFLKSIFSKLKKWGIIPTKATPEEVADKIEEALQPE